MKRSLLFTLVAALVLATGCQSVNIRSDVDVIRTELIKMQPLGTPLQVLETWLRSKGYRNITVVHTRGFYRGWGPRGPETVGVKSIEASLGQYYSSAGYLTIVSGSWAFNEQGQLIEVWVKKAADGP